MDGAEEDMDGAEEDAEKRLSVLQIVMFGLPTGEGEITAP